MKLASLKSSKNRDGELILVSGQKYVKASDIVSSLREALENWAKFEPRLSGRAQDLETGNASGIKALNVADLHSCLPRTWLFADGSAFIHHIKLVRKARNAALPETLETVPLMYQGESASFLRSTQAIPQVSPEDGTDFEAEVGVITDDVPMGVTPEKALSHIRLLVLINDVSLRGLIPAELAQGFGFFQSKPASSLSPFALTPDELGSAWQGGRVKLPINVKLNGQFFGKPNASEMHFHFGQLIAHAARTRALAAGTLVGSGTISNENSELGSGCLAEKRTLEQIATGKPTTPFMQVGDRVEIWMEDEKGHDLFGRIDQKVERATGN